MLYFVSACTGEQADQEATAMLDNNRPDIIATNAFYYYHDVEAAWIFYRDTLGLETVVDYGFAKILRLAESSYLTLVKADEGMHSADEPKNVTLHLITDELNRWHEYAVQQGMRIEYDAVTSDDSLGDSFVTFDSEGYRLRFVRYNPHPNHSSFVETFTNATPVARAASGPGDMSIRATVFTVYYEDVEDVQSFFEGLFDVTSAGVLNGVPLYQLASSGFVSLEKYSDDLPASPGENGVTLSFLTTDVDAWFERASAWSGFELRTPEVFDESGLVRVFVGYDPAGIFLEWDTFLDLPENRVLLDHLN
jgi:predicted enzyme related to lactoylglutathione lyase